MSLSDHRVGRAEEHAGREADHPRRKAERVDLRRPDDGADHDANGKPIEECAEEGRPLIGELERKHRRGRQGPVENSAEETEREAGHTKRLARDHILHRRTGQHKTGSLTGAPHLAHRS